MKGSAITGPVGKEAAELWPVGDIGASSLEFMLMPCSVSHLTLVW